VSYASRREASRRWREANPEAAHEASDRFQQDNRERLAETASIRAGVLRTLVFNHYGWSCSCCGSTKHPTIDHVNGDGRQHREELSGHNVSGVVLWRWLVQNGFPEGFQTLCNRCNTSKGTGPACRINHRSAA
jgi:hypothetical protein